METAAQIWSWLKTNSAAEHHDFILVMVSFYFATSIWDGARQRIRAILKEQLDASLQRTVTQFKCAGISDAPINQVQDKIDRYDARITKIHRIYAVMSFTFAIVWIFALYFKEGYYEPALDVLLFIPLIFLLSGHLYCFLGYLFKELMGQYGLKCLLKNTPEQKKQVVSNTATLSNQLQKYLDTIEGESYSTVFHIKEKRSQAKGTTDEHKPGNYDPSSQ